MISLQETGNLAAIIFARRDFPEPAFRNQANEHVFHMPSPFYASKFSQGKMVSSNNSDRSKDNDLRTVLGGKGSASEERSIRVIIDGPDVVGVD
jgi:hypothetical protein